MSADFSISRSTVIDAPAREVLAHVEDFHAWEAWSPWEKLDPSLQRTYSGAERGVGAKYAWSGNRKAGAGTMEIVNVVPGELVRVDLRFTKPFKATNEAIFAFREVGGAADRAGGGGAGGEDVAGEGGPTEVTWTMNGRRNLMMRIMGRFMDMDAMIGKDFEKGLADLKRVSERDRGA